MKRFGCLICLSLTLLCSPSQLTAQYGAKFAMYNYCLPLAVEASAVGGEYTYFSRTLQAITEEAFRLVGIEVVPLSENDSDSHLSIKTVELPEHNHFSYEVEFVRFMVVDGESGYATTSRAGSTTQSFASRDEAVTFHEEHVLPVVVDYYLAANKDCDMLNRQS